MQLNPGAHILPDSMDFCLNVVHTIPASLFAGLKYLMTIFKLVSIVGFFTLFNLFFRCCYIEISIRTQFVRATDI